MSWQKQFAWLQRQAERKFFFRSLNVCVSVYICVSYYCIQGKAVVSKFPSTSSSSSSSFFSSSFFGAAISWTEARKLCVGRLSWEAERIVGRGGEFIQILLCSYTSVCWCYWLSAKRACNLTRDFFFLNRRKKAKEGRETKSECARESVWQETSE